MAKQTINIGASPNDGTGTPLRTSFDYCNQNFTELYTATGPSGNNIVVPGNATITGDLTVRTTKLKVDATGVGIGTATPLVPLHAETAGTGTTAFANFVATFRSQAAGRDATLQFSDGTNQAAISMLSGALSFGTAGANTRYQIDGTGISTWSVAGTTAMTLNSTGLGIGGSPSYKLDVVGPVMRLINSAATADIFITDSGTTNGNVRLRGESNALKFITGGGVSATLDANGYLLVGKTSVSPSNAGCELQTGTGGNAASVFVADGAFASIMNRLTSDGTIIDFRRQTSSVGYIAVTTLATTYNSISDYRLKEAVQPLVGGLARVSALKPSIYKWKVNGSDGEGFLAHELAEVVPSAVTGEKDAVNEDGSIKAQGVDMSRIVPILVAAIQELTARVQTLEAK